jgi:flavin-dependent dehydrogenase
MATQLNGPADIDAPWADEHADVVIVGARCAGTAAASVFARAGKRVVVLDKARFPSDTLSTHTLFGPAIEELRTLGAWEGVSALDPPMIDAFHAEFRNGRQDAAVYHEQLTEQTGYAINVPRLLLDQELVSVVRTAGADVRERCTVTDVIRSGGRVAGVVYRDIHGELVRLSAPLVLGADGQESTVAGLVGASTPYRYSHSDRVAVYRYANDPVVDGPAATTMYHWKDGTSTAFLFPSTPRGTMLVLFLADGTEVDEARADIDAYWARKLYEHPAVAQRVAGATDWSEPRITTSLASYFRKSTGPGWALVGDAGHFKDPVLGQGIRDALWAGRTLADATVDLLDSPWALDRALSEWERQRDRECKLAYLAGTYAARLTVDSDGFLALVRAINRYQLPVAATAQSRSGKLLSVLTPWLIVRAVARAVRDSENRRAAVGDVHEELRLLVPMIRSATRSRFRDETIVPGLDNQRGGWPRRPTTQNGRQR